jgi:hypothetical protein
VELLAECSAHRNRRRSGLPPPAPRVRPLAKGPLGIPNFFGENCYTIYYIIDRGGFIPSEREGKGRNSRPLVANNRERQGGKS